MLHGVIRTVVNRDGMDGVPSLLRLYRRYQRVG